MKCLFSNRAIWVCIAVMYGAVLVGNSIPTYRDIKEEYYKFYMTDQQGKMTEEKVEYFNEERKRFEEIYSMTPENSDLTAVEIVQKQEENKYAHEGFSEAYSQVMYIMSNNQGKGVNEQELVYEKGYQLLFGDKAVKERLIGILLCVIAAVYSASGVLGTEYDLKVMNLLRSTKRGRKELFLKKLGVSFGITAVIFVLVKIPAILKVVGEYPLECWGAKVRSMMFLLQALLNDPKILILDEPTAGLDPKERIRIRNLISDLSQDRIVLIATHVVSDIEFISKEILLMKNGRLIDKASPEQLQAKIQGKVFEMSVGQQELEEVKEKFEISNLFRKDGQIIVRVVTQKRPEGYDEIREAAPTLEDVYLYEFEVKGAMHNNAVRKIAGT